MTTLGLAPSEPTSFLGARRTGLGARRTGARRTAPRRALYAAWGLVLLGVAFGPPAAAQPVITPGIAVHRYHEVGEPVKAIDVWGSIRMTGRFFLPTDADLLELLTLAGGPPAQAETGDVVRAVTVTVARANGSSHSVLFRANVDSLAVGAVVAPPLLDGDIVTLTTSARRPFGWRDALSIGTTVAAGVLLILRIANTSGI